MVGLVYLLATLLGIILTRQGGNIAALWPPNAILVGVLLRTPRQDWLGYMAGGLLANALANSLMGDPVTAALGFALGNALEIVTFVAIVGRFTPLPVVVSAAVHPLTLLLASLLSAALGATAGSLLLNMAFGIPRGEVWSTWWIADAMGFAIITPVVLSASWSDVRRLVG